MNRFEFRPATSKEYWLNHPLREFHAQHLALAEHVIVAFQKCLDEATDERPIQSFLEQHPGILAQLLHASVRFVLPRHRLGSELIPDFVIGEHHSDGYSWVVVELESPRLSFFTSTGDPRAQLTHALRQVQDWRAWL